MTKQKIQQQYHLEGLEEVLVVSKKLRQQEPIQLKPERLDPKTIEKRLCSYSKVHPNRNQVTSLSLSMIERQGKICKSQSAQNCFNALRNNHLLILAMYRQGNGCKKISDTLRVKKMTVYKFLNANNFINSEQIKINTDKNNSDRRDHNWALTKYKNSVNAELSENNKYWNKYNKAYLEYYGYNSLIALRSYYLNHEERKESSKEYQKKRYQEMTLEEKKEKLFLHSLWRKQNSNKLKFYRRKYNQSEKGRSTMRKLTAKYNKLPENKIKNSLRARFRDFIKYNSSNISNMTGCSSKFLKKYLESKFTKKMNWDNYGKYWHIDHIMPCSVFDLTKEDQVKICFNWQNLQPLEAEKNISKSNNITEPQIQMALQVFN